VVSGHEGQPASPARGVKRHRQDAGAALYQLGHQLLGVASSGPSRELLVGSRSLPGERHAGAQTRADPVTLERVREVRALRRQLAECTGPTT
jgi:hypothetical protein